MLIYQGPRGGERNFSGEWRLAGSEVGIQILLLSKLTGSPARASLPAYVPYGGYSTLYPLSDSLLGVDELWDRWRCLEVMNALGLDDILDGPPSLRYGEVQCAS